MIKNGSGNALMWDEFCKHAVGGAVCWSNWTWKCENLKQIQHKYPRTMTARYIPWLLPCPFTSVASRFSKYGHCVKRDSQTLVCVFKQEEEDHGGKMKIICRGFLPPHHPPSLTPSHSLSLSLPPSSAHFRRHSSEPFRRFPEEIGANKGTQLVWSVTWGRKTSVFRSPNLSKVVVSMDLTVLNATWQRPRRRSTEVCNLHDV